MFWILVGIFLFLNDDGDETKRDDKKFMQSKDIERTETIPNILKKDKRLS